MNPRVVPNASCTFCGCVCDDIELHADDTRIVNARHACGLGASWFRHHRADRAHPDAMIDGKPAPLDAAIDAAAGYLDAAHLPLVYGLSNATSEAQREAVLLAEAIGGVIDSHTSLCHGPTEIGSQLAGKVTCTLGEVTNRADFVLYWGANPAESHPRHFTKYTLMPKGRFVPAGRKDRTMVLVDVRETPSVKAADVFLQIRPGKDFEAASALRAIVKGLPVHHDRVAETGLAVAQLEDLAARMTRARFGAIFFGMGLAMTRGRHMNAAAILTLTAELNAFTKFVCMPMRGHGNVAGADAVLRRMTGYTFGVDLSRGYPRSNPGEFSAVDMLARGDNDATLVLGADPGATMPQAAIDHLDRVPTIVLDPQVTHTSRLARVHITTAATGVSAAGTAYRMDGVPLPLRPALRSPYPTDEDVIRRIRRAIVTRSRGNGS